MSSKTLKANAKKTKSAPKKDKKLLYCIVAFIAIVISLLVLVQLTNQTVAKDDTVYVPQSDCQGMQLLDACIPLERAVTQEQRTQGLSGRDSLAPNTGMLFMSEVADTECFWMKDMKFNLDIVWLDSQKKIIEIRKNLSPDTYPTNYCTGDAQYVIELNAGDTSRLGMATGQQIQF